MTTTQDRIAAERNDRTGDDLLVSPAWLAAHLGDPKVRVIEIDVSAAAYDDWHVDGAVLWNVYADLKDAEYQLVDDAHLQSLLMRSGIGPESTVVFYGYAPAMGVWLLTLLGHPDARILDCSRETWRADGRPWTTGGPGPIVTRERLGGGDAKIRADHA